MIYEYTVTPRKRLRCGNIARGMEMCIFCVQHRLYSMKNSSNQFTPRLRSPYLFQMQLFYPRLRVYSKSPICSCRLCSIYGLCISSVFDMQQRQIFRPEACPTKEKKVLPLVISPAL